MSPQSTFWDLMRAMPCTYCGADVGARCRTSGGALTNVLHSARYYAAKRMLRDVLEGAE